MLYRLIVSTFRSLVACNALKETVVLFNIVVETMIYLFIFIFLSGFFDELKIVKKL